MLVLGRKIGQKIIVSGPCEIVLVHSVGGFARIGVKAADHVQIDRPDKKECSEDGKSQDVTEAQS